ncbi:L-asparaginase [Chitinivorax tropicus]|uniref:L-asparaginase n=1 Tax=Chitinivorax tropicus TaxID=714531 RepID=A0A840MI62_9PROT|nr:asparaginase domain-containing protein [Chitinivorax tropicus]MBB5018338.1 L-asparaginase [Chitinivorax tropicus]
MSLRIITTGGTIDKIYFDAKSNYEIGEPMVTSILEEGLATVPHVVQPILRKDSLELTDDDRQLIYDTVAAAPEQHIVITHGTDTMPVTAAKLKSIQGKTIVLTGAMAPARFRITDSIFNIGCAVAAAQALPAGVYITMNGRIFEAGKVRKNLELGRFEATE